MTWLLRRRFPTFFVFLAWIPVVCCQPVLLLCTLRRAWNESSITNGRCDGFETKTPSEKRALSLQGFAKHQQNTLLSPFLLPCRVLAFFCPQTGLRQKNDQQLGAKRNIWARLLPRNAILHLRLAHLTKNATTTPSKSAFRLFSQAHRQNE